MKYIADILTLSRLALATALLLIGLFDHSADIGVGFSIFVLAELTDAFDGTFATRFPFPKDEIPKYRKYAATYDMVADALTALAGALFFTFRVNLVAGLIMIIGHGIITLAVELVVYGRFFGHPDNCSPQSLIKRNFALAKKLIMARRMLYLILIAIITTWMLYATNLEIPVKIVVTVILVALAIFLWFFEAQRRHHISRDAVNVEDSLAKKSAKK